MHMTLLGFCYSAYIGTYKLSNVMAILPINIVIKLFYIDWSSQD